MILLATSTTTLQARYTECLQPFGLVIPLSHYQLLLRTLEKLHPPILFLDFTLPGFSGAEAITHIRQLSPLTKIVIIGNRVAEEIRIDLFIAGVCGYCTTYSDKPQIEKIILSIKQGELCIPRALVAPLLQRLKDLTALQQPENEESSTLLLSLTKREKEISFLIGNGHNNKEIARKLEITERTVKAHLTEIFRKLGIADRLTLALLVSGKQHKTVRHPPLSLVKAH